MGKWFRFYDEALDDPKVQRLDPETFKGWVNLLCLASRNDGTIPALEDVAFALRIDIIAARSLVDRLTIAGLIATVKGGANGSRIAPNGWDKRQYKSDTSTERVKRFRKRSGNAEETPPETDTDTEQNISPNGDTGSADPAVKPEHVFEAYQDLAKHLGIAVPRDLTPERRQLVKGRISQYSIEDFFLVFDKCRASPFLRGDRQGRTPLSFDWLMKKGNFQKTLEGNYDG